MCDILHLAVKQYLIREKCHDKLNLMVKCFKKVFLIPLCFQSFNHLVNVLLFTHAVLCKYYGACTAKNSGIKIWRRNKINELISKFETQIKYKYLYKKKKKKNLSYKYDIGIKIINSY